MTIFNTILTSILLATFFSILKSSKKNFQKACISSISFLFLFASMFYFNHRVDLYFYTKNPLSTPLEYIIRTIGHSNTSKMMYCPQSLFIIPNYHGPFPVDYQFVLKPTDVIFDVSPAGYQPWRIHRKNLKNYFTFKYTDVSKYSIETINKTIHHQDILLLKNHFKGFLAHNMKTFHFAEKGDRFIFLCNIPRCVTHVIMALAFMEIYSIDFQRPCHITEYMPTFMERFLIYDDKQTSSSFQYMEWTTSSYKYNYDPNFFAEEDLHFGQLFKNHIQTSSSSSLPRQEEQVFEF